MTTTAEQTLGEYRVGTDFNPSGDELVNEIERCSAAMIDDLQSFKADATGEAVELLDRAQTEIELAAMYGVKAATKPPAPAEGFTRPA